MSVRLRLRGWVSYINGTIWLWLGNMVGSHSPITAAWWWLGDGYRITVFLKVTGVPQMAEYMLLYPVTGVYQLPVESENSKYLVT